MYFYVKFTHSYDLFQFLKLGIFILFNVLFNVCVIFNLSVKDYITITKFVTRSLVLVVIITVYMNAIQS